MKIVSTTLTGSNESEIGAALASVVEQVDACMVIDTGAKDNTLDVARSVAGEKLIVRTFTWCSDFSAARNFALEEAACLRFAWCITVDTDERIEWNGVDLKVALRLRDDVNCWMVRDRDGGYAKERIFHMPAKARFSGPTHETFPSPQVGYAILDRARFFELKKTPEQLRAKFERDARILGKYTKTHWRDPRWLYYLGDALHGLGQHNEAIDAFKRCAMLRGWNEESAWACYRAAECACVLKRWDDAVDFCSMGLARHAGIGELAWLAAFASWSKGDKEQAVYWARMSAELSVFVGRGASVQRIGFRFLPALYEGPWDVLRHSLKGSQAEDAERMYHRALAARNELHRND